MLVSVFTAFLFMTTTLSAQDNLFEAFVKKASASLLTVSYEYSTKLSGVNTIGDGSFSIQGTSYYHSGSGLEIWCDGESVWTADPSVKEMVIESVAGSSSPFASNPTLVLVNPDSSFKIESIIKTGDETQFHLRPQISCGVSDCILTFSGDVNNPVIRRAVLTLDDGTVFKMTFKDVAFSSDLKQSDFFRPGNLGPSWVVTDLR